MLSQIPGISSKYACALMKTYKTLKNLITNLETNSNCLNGFSYINEKGQKRKLPNNIPPLLIKYLL